MTKLKNTYDLKAFPAGKVLKEFHPVRGMRFHAPIQLTKEDQESYWAFRMNKYADAKIWAETRIDFDVRPVFRLIAEAMGYDPELLIAGQGETGKPEDSWTVYADQGRVPMLVRWTIGEAQLLLTFCLDDDHYEGVLAMILVLGDAQAAPHMGTIARVLRQVEGTVEPIEHVDVATGNTLQKLRLPNQAIPNFNIRSVMIGMPAGAPRPAWAEDLDDLAHSTDFRRRDAMLFRDRDELLRRGELDIINTNHNIPTFRYGPTQRVSREVVELVHRQSAKDIRKLMNFFLSDFFQKKLQEGSRPVPVDDLVEDTSRIDAALRERKTKLSLIAHSIEFPVMESLGLLHQNTLDQCLAPELTSVGRGFTTVQAETLRDTGPYLKMAGGDVAASVDLLDLAVWKLLNIVQDGLQGHRQVVGSVRLTGTVTAPIVAEQYRDASPTCHQVVDLTNPYYASHRGIPVRVDKSLTVWRKNQDTEALAVDFFHLPETGDMHLANLHRVKVPD